MKNVTVRNEDSDSDNDDVGQKSEPERKYASTTQPLKERFDRDRVRDSILQKANTNLHDHVKHLQDRLKRAERRITKEKERRRMAEKSLWTLRDQLMCIQVQLENERRAAAGEYQDLRDYWVGACSYMIKCEKDRRAAAEEYDRVIDYLERFWRL